MKLSCSTSDPPLGGLFVAEHVVSRCGVPVDVSWGAETLVDGRRCRGSGDVARLVAPELCGSGALEATQVDHWITFSSGPLRTGRRLERAVAALDAALAPSTYLVGGRIGVADYVTFAALYANEKFQAKMDLTPSNVLRWYNFMLSQEAVARVLAALPAEVKTALRQPVRQRRSSTRQSLEKPKARAQEGKFVELPGAEVGKVVVRFPPEASGYLHIGHAKAALLNQYYQEAFQGQLIMRFDDTNPAKENAHFEKVILEDVAMLRIKPDRFTHTSEYFDLMIEYCERLLKEGKAYVDDTDAETMKAEREQRIESKNRNKHVDENFRLWNEMKAGSEEGQRCCVRAKIDMQSANGCMRDPTIYRCKNETHPRTGDTYKVYPTYDFACPIVDAIEGVTHTLRTMEYHDRDPQFYWFIEALGLRRPYIWEYSRLSMTNTVLSKRKLTWFVENGLVDGWDDPRMPTVRGVLRRGMTVEGLKEFIVAQGSSRSVVFMEWDKIWAFNKKVIDPIAPRYTAIDACAHVPVMVSNCQRQAVTVPKHPKNPDVGTKRVLIGPDVLIDRVDADLLKEGENATFINWGNLMIRKVKRDADGKVTGIEATANVNDKDYKKTPKITWLAVDKDAQFTPTYCVYFDHLISKPLLGKDEDFKKYVGHQTRREVAMYGDPELKSLKLGDIIQLQRRGFFRVDVAYRPRGPHTGKEQPLVLFSVPDGHVNENPLGLPMEEKSGATVKAEEKLPEESAEELSSEIAKQGDLVRSLKAEKAPKDKVQGSVKVLLELKTKYKTLTGNEWKPQQEAPGQLVKAEQKLPEKSAEELSSEIAKQGDLVRSLKAEKAPKNKIQDSVKVLLELKTKYKALTGNEWKPQQEAPGQLSADDLSNDITKQGDLVRSLKAEKAPKDKIQDSVKVLLELKTKYKALTGKEWKPQEVKQEQKSAEDICIEIAKQDVLVRSLKAKNAPKEKIEDSAKVLLELKNQFQTLTSDEWKPQEIKQEQMSVDEICKEITKQGDLVRSLKAEKAPKDKIQDSVKVLLELKNQYKTLTGNEWKPQEVKKEQKVKGSPVKTRDRASAEGDKPSVTDTTIKAEQDVSSKEDLTKAINAQGDIVRELKTKKAPKNEIDAAVKTLLELKASYRSLTGTDFPSQTKAPPKQKEPKPKPAVAESGPKKQTRLGLEARKEESLSDWYSQVITKGEMIEYYDVSGCYILRPWSFAVWEAIRDWFDAEIKKLGVQNCYFPIFVSAGVLEKEKDHIADFAPEVAWVTKSGDSDLAEPIAVRPTSETVMYPAYAKWIQSYRDLPIKLNQWNNVVRWEFKHPQPFLRTREFLWQEGHTAYADEAEARREVETIIDLYAKIYTDLLAVPVVRGRKTEKEKFAGGDYTLTVEAFVSASGRGIQGATSHHLAQNFSRMFDVSYEDPESQEKRYVYQNSWGITTRTIGVMIMVHSDNRGLVLPPRVASVQVVIVPCGITADLAEDKQAELLGQCVGLERELVASAVRVKGDHRMNYSPGWKFNHWELKGVPIRVELGPKDIEKDQLVAVRRDTGDKLTLPRRQAVPKLKQLLEEIQNNLYKRACDDLSSHVVRLTDWSKFTATLDKKNLIMAPFCGDSGCEDRIKAESTREDDGAEPGAPSMGAKALCIPSEQPAAIGPDDKCIHPSCGRRPSFYTLFGRSY